MPESNQLRQDEEAYWQSARQFVRLLIAELDRTLRGSRISGKKRKQICTTFAFEFCNFLDHRWFKPGGRTEYPLLCFAKSYFDIDVPLESSQINFPHKSVELHGMVHDEIEWFFNEVKEDNSAVATGDVGDETEDIDEAVNESESRFVSPCPVCGGSGQCFCLRKGVGHADGCPRCGGTGECKHCKGKGEWIHP